LRGFLDADVNAAIDRWPRVHPIEPALEIRKLLEVLSLPTPVAGPADARHIGDRIATGEKIAILQAAIHHAIEPVDLVGEALGGVRRLRGRVETEVMTPAGLGAEIGHLPEQPLIDFNTSALIARIELAGLAPEILQDRTRLEDRDRPPVRSLRVDDR